MNKFSSGLDDAASRAHVLNMFNSTEEANTRYARAAGRIVFGVVLILGAATFVERLMRMEQPAAAKTLAIVWLAACFAGWLFSQLAAVTKQHVETEQIFTASYVLPAIGVALMLPLTLHIPVALAVGVDMHAFDDWARLSMFITGPAHVIFAILVARRAGQLAKGRPAISTARIFITTLVVSSIPFAVIMFIPPLVVGLTGVAILPLLQRMPAIIERERGTYELPTAIVVA